MTAVRREAKVWRGRVVKGELVEGDEEEEESQLWVSARTKPIM